MRLILAQPNKSHSPSGRVEPQARRGVWQTDNLANRIAPPRTLSRPTLPTGGCLESARCGNPPTQAAQPNKRHSPSGRVEPQARRGGWQTDNLANRIAPPRTLRVRPSRREGVLNPLDAVTRRRKRRSQTKSHSPSGRVEPQARRGK